jgi:hypothetical protein
VLDHNDEWYLRQADEEEQEEEEGQHGTAGAGHTGKRAAGGKARRSGAGAGLASSLPSKLPVRLPGGLTLVALGEVHWLHPNFHTEGYIWPRGYRASRVAKTAASGHQVRLRAGWWCAAVASCRWLCCSGEPNMRASPLQAEGEHAGGMACKPTSPTAAWSRHHHREPCSTPAHVMHCLC